MARIAVVIPAFEPGEYLEIALRSVIAQSFEDWECVVVDDGSSQSLSWVDHRDPRIRLIRQRNAGVATARNRGVAETTAPLIAFLDADDAWLPGNLVEQMRAFADPSVVMSSADFEMIDSAGMVIGPGFVGHNSSYEEILSGCGLLTTTVMVRREAFNAVGGFRDFKIAEDWDLWIRLSTLGNLARSDLVLGQYRKHGSNTTLNYRELLRESTRVLAQHDHPNALLGIARIRQLSAYQAFDCARNGQTGIADRVRALVWSVRYEPGYVIRSVASWILRQTREVAPHVPGGSARR